ncbi:MAG TPA: polysaccharide biosynthesis tyrosine autokinase [Cyclobacteriaceae bacterium]|nr:polysaccharide biosynthesis tyrosine autokinase [Cyclobacteriaceae bacterium]
MNQSFFDQEQAESHQGSKLDFKRVLARAIRFWYVVVFCFVGAIAIAFYQTRYSQRVYPISASIMIRETQETGGAELLYKNALIDPYRNYLNEPYIIRSYPLIEKVIRSLNFNASFYREGYFMTTEAYDYIPVKATWCDPEIAGPGQFIFKLVDSAHYSLKSFSGSKSVNSETVYPLDDTVQFYDLKICINRLYDRPIKPYIGVPFLLVIRDVTTVAGFYVGQLSVEWAEEGAGVINLGLTGTNSKKEIDFLNGLIQEYRENDLERKNETGERTIEFIRDQLLGIKDSLRIVEYQLERFGNSSRIKDMSAEAQRLFAKAEAFEVQKAELLIRQNYYQYLEEYLSKDETSFDQIILPSSVGLTDPVLNSLLTKMMDLQLEIKLRIDAERGKNPLVQEKITRIQGMKRDVLESVNTLKSTDKIKMDFLKKELSDIDHQLTSLPASERQLISVQRNYSLLENLYVFLMQKLSEAGISKASNTSDIIPVNPPMQGSAISPKPLQNYAIAAVLGLLIPFSFFVLFEILNNKVQSKEDIEKRSSIPFIGGVGHNTSGTNLPVKNMPKSGLAESFRALRSNLNFFTGNQSKKVFMVSSSISGEGKTFTTINLATVFALSGKKTLIVGADMRRPKIFQDFERDNTVGLSTFLSGISEFQQIIQSTEIENLFLVSGGPVPPNPSELLLTNKFEDFIKNAVDQFDFVLIDTPPLALVTDAFVISKFVDHTVFVMRQNYSPKDFVKSIDDYYRSGKIKNISILLNDIYKSGLGYGYGQGYSYEFGYGYASYGRYGGYYSDDQVERKSFMKRLFRK